MGIREVTGVTSLMGKRSVGSAWIGRGGEGVITRAAALEWSAQGGQLVRLAFAAAVWGYCTQRASHTGRDYEDL